MTTDKVTAAPPLDCAVCGKTIGRTATHALTATGVVLHQRCLEGGRDYSSKRVHARIYPDCPHPWHDMYDHRSITGTRAGIAWQLGLWGRPLTPADTAWRLTDEAAE